MSSCPSADSTMTAASRFAHSSADPRDGDVRWGPRRPVRLASESLDAAAPAPADRAAPEARARAPATPDPAARDAEEEESEHEHSQRDDQHGDHVGLLPDLL